MRDEERFLIGELAEQAGVNRETLRYYERRGLLKPARRTASSDTVRAGKFFVIRMPLSRANLIAVLLRKASGACAPNCTACSSAPDFL